jgi:hypothetical protein
MNELRDNALKQFEKLKASLASLPVITKCCMVPGPYNLRVHQGKGIELIVMGRKERAD